jgi:iron complex transport system substrate-binding protein
VKFGHGPATVIGRRCGLKSSTGARRVNRAMCAGKDRSGCNFGASSARISGACVQLTRRGKVESQETYPGSCASALREKGRGWEAPFFSWGFFIEAEFLRRLMRTRKMMGRALALAALTSAVISVGARAASAAPRGDATRVVVDETGRRVTLPAEVHRIVSLAPNLTETIYAIGAGARLAGDTDFCDVPDEAKAKPHVGAPINPSLEAIVALKPDVVLASASINWPATADALLKMGVPVYTTDPHSVDDMIAGIAHIGEVIGADGAANSLVAGLRARLAAVEEKLAGRSPRRVLFIVWDDPLISIGKHTFIADALRLSGGVSVIDVEQNWPHVGLEHVVRLQPEFLVFTGDHGEASKLDELREKKVWRELEAVKAGRVAFISGEVNRPAPKLVDAIEDLARQLHPEAFAKAPDAGGAR